MRQECAKPHDHLLVALRRIIRSVDLQSRQLVHQQNVTVPQLLTLKTIAAESEVTLGALAKRIGLSNATVSGIADRLEQRDLVERRRGSSDRRQTLLSLTPSGRDLVARAPALLQDRFTTAFDALPQKEQRQLVGALETVAALMGAEHLDAAPLLASHPATATEQMVLSASAPGGGGDAAAAPAQANPAAAVPTDGLDIRHIAAAHELPEWIGIDDLVAFLHEEMQPYHDAPHDIRRGVSNALTGCPAHGGFILVALRGRRLVGVLVMLATGMNGYAPEHMLLFVAVKRGVRGGGIGRRLIERALALTPGDVKLHVEYDNPARRLYERLGFVSKYAEMRVRR